MSTGGSHGPLDLGLQVVANHMQNFGLVLLGHGIEHIIISGRGSVPYSEALGVVHVAHAGEMLVKSAIAAQHPLLVFKDLPKMSGGAGAKLSFELVAKEGRSLDYKDLPDRLWAATGFQMPNTKIFLEFGQLRNAIQHFATDRTDFEKATLEYACSCLDPLVQHTMGQGVFEAMAEVWAEQDDYLFEDDLIGEALRRSGIQYGGIIPTN